MATLSGGNQQKVMVARWMAQGASLFMLDEPFQGVDIAARHDIAAKLRANAAGRATLIFVTELDEALETADRILVMSEHTIVGEHVNAGIDMERLLAEVAGQRARERRMAAPGMTQAGSRVQHPGGGRPCDDRATSPSATASWRCCSA